jgi:hypothetical protein
MKKVLTVLAPLTMLTLLLISACSGVAASEEKGNGSKVEPSLVEFTGVIESIDGNQWVINGQALTVDPAIVRDGPFDVGDTVKVEAEVALDGSITVTRVELPSADENSNDDNGNDDNSNDDNGNDDNSNDDNGNDDNSNDDNGNDDNSNDDNGNDDNSNDDNGNDDDSNDNDSGSGGGNSGDDDDDDDDDSGSGGDD